MKFKVGDKVRVVKPKDGDYHGISRSIYLDVFVNRVFTISYADRSENRYQLAGHPYIFRGEMFEPVKIKYRVGDAVKINENLNTNFNGYNKVAVSNDMARQHGKVMHIKSIGKDNPDGIIRYKLKEDFLSWNWTDDMFEGRVKHKPIVIYQEDDSTVVALDKDTMMSGTAVCSKDDVFEFTVGAELAFERLISKLEEDEESEPTTAMEKRKWLSEFCKGRRCPNCVLNSPTCRCGCGTHFLTKAGDGKFGMTDAEINLAYALVKTVEER